MTDRIRYIFLILTVTCALSSCQSNPSAHPVISTEVGNVQQVPIEPAGMPTSMPIIQPQSTFVPNTATSYPGYTEVAADTATITCPRTILFYGDSRMGGFGQSFVDDIADLIGPCYKLVLADYWGRTAEWGWNNFSEKVLAKNPNDVVLWWGGNDFGGCLQTTVYDTNLPYIAKFNAALGSYLSALKNQIDTLAELGKGVYVLNEPRVKGGLLPWAVIDSSGNITYDHNHLCPYDWVSDAMAEAQRQLVANEVAQGHNVILLDAWQLYMDNQGVEGMYSTDVVHAGSVGRQKLAELFMKNYQP